MLPVDTVRADRMERKVSKAYIAQTEGLVEEILELEYLRKHRKRLACSSDELLGSEVVEKRFWSRRKLVMNPDEQVSHKRELDRVMEMVKINIRSVRKGCLPASI